MNEVEVARQVLDCIVKATDRPANSDREEICSIIGSGIEADLPGHDIIFRNGIGADIDKRPLERAAHRELPTRIECRGNRLRRDLEFAVTLIERIRRETGGAKAEPL